VVGEMLAAWVALPVVALVASVGLALLLERVAGHRLGVLRVPVGLCAGICLSFGVYWLDGPAFVAGGIIVLGAAAGLSLEWRELVAWRPGWFSLAWLAAYGLYLAPVVLSGEPTWAGYNFVNDTATQMVLADYLTQHGVAPPEGPQLSTAAEFVRGYLGADYPVGSHALLGTLDEIVPGSLPSIYQPYIAVLAASAAVALGDLARRSGLPAAAAAAAGALAVGANLFYQYALQGNLKEMAFFMALATSAAVGRQLIAAARPLRASAAAAVSFAAAFDVYSAAAAPYLLALGGVLAVAALWRRGRASVPRLATGGVALAAGALALAVPALAGAMTFKEVASSTFAGAAREADFGQLLRPLKLEQVAGVWLTADYRGPVPPGRELLTAGLCVLIGALIVAGIIWAVRRREPAALLLLTASALAAAYLLPRLSPYADGKVLALASPVALLGAGIGAWSFVPLSRVAAALMAAAVVVGVLWSNAFAYHGVRLAPTERLDALADTGHRLRDARGLVLVNEPEEFAKVYRGDANFNTPTEAFTPAQIRLRVPQSFLALYFDLDAQLLDYVEQFPTIVKRRSPDASRPPANYRLVYANGWYETWRRMPGVKVIDHLPLQGVHRAAAKPNCKDVRAMRARARPGDLLLGARTAPMVVLDTARARRPSSWPDHPSMPDMVVPLTPGSASARPHVKHGGRYEAWVAGSLGRRIEVRVDGQLVGAAVGVNNLGQWLPAGEVTLGPGAHTLRLTRPGGNLEPGDGYQGDLGPLVLQPVGGSTTLERFTAANARRLCGRSWDWIELVREGAPKG
jgi:hypothetical protein